jgi:hypothetical protein
MQSFAPEFGAENFFVSSGHAPQGSLTGLHLIASQSRQQKHQCDNPEPRPNQKIFRFGYVSVHWLLQNSRLYA